MTKDELLNSITKAELVERLSSRQHWVSANEMKEIVNLILEGMAYALCHGHRVEVRDFGSLGVRIREPRRARNPKTGASVHLGKKPKVFFKQSRYFKKIGLSDEWSK